MRNVIQLTAACAELIADPALRERLGSNGLNLVKEKFAPDTMVDTIERVYEQVMIGDQGSGIGGQD